LFQVNELVKERNEREKILKRDREREREGKKANRIILKNILDTVDILEKGQKILMEPR